MGNTFFWLCWRSRKGRHVGLLPAPLGIREWSMRSIMRTKMRIKILLQLVHCWCCLSDGCLWSIQYLWACPWLSFTLFTFYWGKLKKWDGLEAGRHQASTWGILWRDAALPSSSFSSSSLWSFYVCKKMSSSYTDVKMSVPQNCPLSIYFGKYQLVAPLPDKTATQECCRPAFLLHSCRSESEHSHTKSTRVFSRWP